MKNIKSMRLRRFIAEYIRYLEILAYALVVLVGVGVAAAWSWRVNVTAASKDGDLKPFEHEVKAAERCAVVALAVEDKTDVRKGDVIVEVCFVPEWIIQVEAMAHLRKVIQAMRSSEPKPDEDSEDEDPDPEQEQDTQDDAAEQEREPQPFRPEFESLGQELLSRLEALEKVQPPSVEKLAAPCDGLAWLGSCEVGKVYDADKKIVGVKDFSQLRAKLTFEAKNVEACKPGLQAEIDIKTEQTFETLIRLNTDSLPHVPYFGARLDQFSRLAHEELRDLLTQAVDGQMLLDEEKAKQADDFPLPATSVDNITLRVSARREADPNAKTALFPENFRTEKLQAVVIDGKHTSGVTLLDVDPQTHQKVTEIVEKLLTQGAIATEDAPFVLHNGLEEVVINLQVNTELTQDEWDLDAHPVGLDPDDFEDDEDKPKGSENVKRKSRKFIGTLQLIEPSDELKQLVRELTIDGESLKVTGAVITGHTRFAMLLFRKH